MHEEHNRLLRTSAEEAASGLPPPDFQAVYRRAARRGLAGRAALGLAAAVTAGLAVLALQPPAPPAFDRQVAAFVQLVWEEE